MVDSKDLQIISALKENSRDSIQRIAKRTKIPITTIHNRIKKLEESGIIKNYTINLDDKKLETISAFVLVTVDYKCLRENNLSQYDLAKKLKSNEAVEHTSMITGASDIILKIRVKNIAQLNEFITTYLRNIHGIERTKTIVILNDI